MTLNELSNIGSLMAYFRYQKTGFRSSHCLRHATLWKKRLCHRCFPVNFAKFLRTPFFTEHLRWLLLKKVICWYRKLIIHIIISFICNFWQAINKSNIDIEKLLILFWLQLKNQFKTIFEVCVQFPFNTIWGKQVFYNQSHILLLLFATN